MVGPQSFNAVFREFITVVKVGTQVPEIKHDIKKNYRAWDSLSSKHAAQFHADFAEKYSAVVDAGVAKMLPEIADCPLLVGRSTSSIFDSLQGDNKVRAHACLASLFAISMATHILPDDPPACSAAHKAVDSALAAAKNEASLSAVILDEELVEFVKGAGALLRIGGVCGLPVDTGSPVDGMMTLARSITDGADPAVFERLTEQMSSGKLDIAAIMGEAAKLLGNVDMSKLDLSGLDTGGMDIMGMMSGMGIDMGTVMGALAKRG